MISTALDGDDGRTPRIQVYKARLTSSGEYVAIKVQRPQMLETVSKDL